MNKTLLVAQREYVEHLRTKTFWIGVLIAPIGIALVYTLMFLLAGKTDLRKYAVLDHSEGAWVSKVIDRRIADDDLDKILGSRKISTEERRPLLDQAKAKLSKLPQGHPLRELLTAMVSSGVLAEIDKAGGWDKASSALKARIYGIVVPWALRVSQSEKQRVQVTSVATGMAMKDYVRVPVPDEGEDTEKVLNQKLQKGEIFAYFVIGSDPLAEEHHSKYVSNNLTDFKLRSWYGDYVTKVVRERHVQRLKKEKDLTPGDVAAIQRSFRFEEKKLSATGEEEAVVESDKVRKYAPLAFVYVLWMAVFMAAQMLLTNTVEEKSNRIIEVLLSSVSPTQLMHGKIYGIALTGLTVVGSWALFFVVGVKLAPSLLSGSTEAQFAKLGLDHVISDPAYLGSFLAYFLSGYLIYAAILVALGSVCNSLKEAQNLQQPVVFLLMVPFVVMFPIVGDPNGTLARIITYIPLYTPFAMMNRAGGPPPLWEYLASSGVILATLWIAFRGAAKVFRVGVLMTGKPPRLGEILKWLRAPVS
ncbi:MAG: ABC transporter permease [Planctomycetes bacterium]|nr:ABC transporter permease [Planctomycetota bacterium]